MWERLTCALDAKGLSIDDLPTNDELAEVLLELRRHLRQEGQTDEQPESVPTPWGRSVVQELAPAEESTNDDW